MSIYPTAMQSKATEAIREMVLSELPSLRLDRNAVEAALDSGTEARIPSRKGIVVIARVCNKLGAGRVVSKADLKPNQVADVANLIKLLSTKIAPMMDTT